MGSAALTTQLLNGSKKTKKQKNINEIKKK
jgi:hypothetical protein